MADISNFEAVDRYTLYDVIIMKSKKQKDLWFAKKKYVSLKEIEDERFHSLNEEVIDGKPVMTGYFYIYGDNIENVQDFDSKPNNQMYELTIIRNDKGEKIIEKGVKVFSRKEIMCLTVSPIRKTKEKKKDYFFLTTTIKQEDFDAAKNKEEIIEGFRRKGLDFQEEPRQGYYQFNTLVFPMAKQIPTIASYENKTIHLETFVKERDNEFRLQRVGRGVFDFGPLKVEGMVSDIQGDMLDVVMLTNWDKLGETNNRNVIHFTSVPRETLSEPTPEGNTIKLTFRVHATTGFKGELGDEVSFELNEDNVKKQLNKTKIAVDFNKGESNESVSVKEEAGIGANAKSDSQVEPQKEAGVVGAPSASVAEDKSGDDLPF